MKTVLVMAMLAMGMFGYSDAQRTYTVKLFEHENLQGKELPVRLSGDQCYTVPPNWENHASSVDIQNSCVVLFDSRGCSGRGLRLETQHDVGTSSLSAVDMNDQVSSLRLC